MDAVAMDSIISSRMAGSMGPKPSNSFMSPWMRARGGSWAVQCRSDPCFSRRVANSFSARGWPGAVRGRGAGLGTGTGAEAETVAVTGSGGPARSGATAFGGTASTVAAGLTGRVRGGPRRPGQKRRHRFRRDGFDCGCGLDGRDPGGTQVVRLDLGIVHVATQADSEALPGQVVVELGLAIPLPGALELGRHHVPSEHLDHHGRQRIG